MCCSPPTSGPLRTARVTRTHTPPAGPGRWHALRTPARLVGQSLHTLRQKPLRPFVDKAAADPDRGSNIADRPPLRQEEDDPPPAGTPRRDGGGPLPGLQRLPFRRGEADHEGSFASTRHTGTSETRAMEVCALRNSVYGYAHVRISRQKLPDHPTILPGTGLLCAVGRVLGSSQR
jgi:hypothetical protein